MNKNNSVSSSHLKPQLLFSIPSSPNLKQSVLENNLQFTFPNGIDISYYEEKPKIYSIVFTNDDSNKYYYYILLFYEKICDNILGSKSSLNRNSDNNNSESYYCPISIIIWSDYSNIDFFRRMLINFYKIIKFDYSYLNYSNNINSNIINGKDNINDNARSNSNIKKDKILSFQKVELLNYLNFCYELPRPPNASIFYLNMRLDKIDYKFQSLLEIPTDDYCFDVLFNTLEISVIIKLFVALLFEKYIVIISNQNMPLFCICEALSFLLFPLEYIYVYIPNLPFEKKDYLNSVCPYLMGINTSELSPDELINDYRIVCDVGTSTLYGDTSKLKLPLEEETKIKSKLILLRSKYKNNYDNFENESNLNNNISNNEPKNLNTADDVIDFNLSFAQNVQKIFLGIFKDNLKDIKDYIKNNNFNSERFLNSLKNQEYKLFFAVIVKTAYFEIFINSMSYLDDCPSRKFINICEYDQKSIDQKNYYKYTFNIPKRLNKLFKVSAFKEIYDEYNEISNIIEQNPNKNIRVLNNQNEYPKSPLKKITTQYYYLNFYSKDNFISFALNYQNHFLYKNVIKDEIITLYKEIYKVYYDEENFLEGSNKLMPDIRLTMTNKTYKKSNKNIMMDYIDTQENIIEAPIKSCCQIYLLIAIFLQSTIKVNNIDNKSIELKKSNNSIINSNIQKKINNDIKRSSTNNKTPNSFLSQFKYNNSNKFILEHIVTIKDKAQIDNIFIFKLFLFAFHKNPKEFPRNLFFGTLSKYSLEELKKIENTKFKYINQTIKCKIREIEKKVYKSPVIRTDSENDDIDDDNKLIRIRKKKKKSNIKTYKRINSCIYLNDIKTKLNVENNEFVDEEGNENNIKQMKMNVVDSVSQVKINDLRNLYVQKKLSQKINSWNGFNLANLPLLTNNSSGDGTNIKDKKNIDPMLISEKICIQLYLYLCKVKMENFNDKTGNTEFLIDLAHSKEIATIKYLILDLRNISLEDLSKSPIHYYCFWLNMYNFLTIFSIIYKCESFSNSHEWNRFIKNSYFTIGNVELSLLEIETFILRDKSISDKIYGIKKYDSQLDLPKIEKFDKIINFGIYMVTPSSPSIRIYFPSNFEESLKFNMNEFFWRSIDIDWDNNELKIPEYLTWIEPNFLENVDKYKMYFNENCARFVEERGKNLNVKIEKYYWKLSFANFKNYESKFW